MENLNFYNFIENSFFEDKEIVDNLESSPQKKINSKHLYDENGSKLFEMITNLDDYYPTRSELEILDQKNVFKKNLPEKASVIEFGSGSNKKVRKELESMVSLNTFVEKEDIASMALFLLSDASENVSGQIMTVDGNTERMN